MHPVSPARQLVKDCEEIIRQRSDAPKLAKSWSGDVWAFAKWARDNLPGFDRHQPRVGFLPSITLTTERPAPARAIDAAGEFLEGTN